MKILKKLEGYSVKEVTKKVIEKLIESKDNLCISIYLPTIAAASSEVKKMPIQLKNLLNNVKKELQESHNMGNREVDELLKPAFDLVGDRIFWQNQKEGLAIFINPEQFYYFRLSNEVPEVSIVSQYFNIIPLIPEVMFKNTYYVLTLSKNQNRVFRCTQESIEKIDIEGIPESLKEISKYDESEKSLSFHSGGIKGSKAIYHGLGEIDANKREELLQYFRQIDQNLTKYLNQKMKSPLVVMCVKDLFPIYREVNSYPYLLENYIEGNPDETAPDSINRSAWDAVKDYFRNQLEDINKIYNDLKGTGKTSTQLEDIVSASNFSRVEYLLIKKNGPVFGRFDPEENKVYLEEEGNGQLNQYDLYNFAANKTISHGGHVYVLDEEEMPDGENIVAMYRF